MSNRKLILFFLALVAAFALMGAGLETKQLSPMLRTQTEWVPAVVRANTTTTASTAGSSGVVFRSIICSGNGTCDSSPTSTTSSLGALPYPARLDVRLRDLHATGGAFASTALTCSSVSIVGVDVFGNDRTETLTSITENEKLTAHAYESVTRVAALGCNAYAEAWDANQDGVGREADDFLIVRVSDRVALRQKIGTSSNVLSVCRINAMRGSPKCARGSAFTVDVNSNTIDLAADDGGGPVSLDNGSAVWISLTGSRL